MTDTLRKTLFDIFYFVAGDLKKPDGAVMTADELFAAPIEDLDVDSLTFLEIIMKCETDLDFELGSVDLDTYKTFGDIETAIAELLAEKKA